MSSVDDENLKRALKDQHLLVTSIWCRFGIHQWCKFSEPKQVHSSYYHDVMRQIRYCGSCNKVSHKDYKRKKHY